MKLVCKIFLHGQNISKLCNLRKDDILIKQGNQTHYESFYVSEKDDLLWTHLQILFLTALPGMQQTL